MSHHQSKDREKKKREREREGERDKKERESKKKRKRDREHGRKVTIHTKPSISKTKMRMIVSFHHQNKDREKK